MNIDPAWPEWAVRQRNAIVWVQAPTAEAAAETATRTVGPMGGWKTGRDVFQEVFTRDETPDHARPGDYPRFGHRLRGEARLSPAPDGLSVESGGTKHYLRCDSETAALRKR